MLSRLPRIAAYSHRDYPGNIRIHQWGMGPDAKYAVGNGPIKYISRQEVTDIINRVTQNHSR